MLLSAICWQSVRQEYTDLESEYNERKGNYDKIAVTLELDKQNLEKECDDFQVLFLKKKKIQKINKN